MELGRQHIWRDGFSYFAVLLSIYVSITVGQLPDAATTTVRTSSTTAACTSSQFRCNNGRCIRLSYVCDGFNDCDMLEDESLQMCPDRIFTSFPTRPVFNSLSAVEAISSTSVSSTRATISSISASHSLSTRKDISSTLSSSTTLGIKTSSSLSENVTANNSEASKSLIIGLAVGLIGGTFVVAIIITALCCIMRRKVPEKEGFNEKEKSEEIKSNQDLSRTDQNHPDYERTYRPKRPASVHDYQTLDVSTLNQSVDTGHSPTPGPVVLIQSKKFSNPFSKRKENCYV